jgi:hypothetical protein
MNCALVPFSSRLDGGPHASGKRRNIRTRPGLAFSGPAMPFKKICAPSLSLAHFDDYHTIGLAVVGFAADCSAEWRANERVHMQPEIR